MAKKTLLGTLAVFVTWSVLDFVMHGLILGNAYRDTAHLWRPEGEMKMGVMYVVTLIVAAAFVYIYAAFIKDKGVATAAKYGLLFGLAAATSMAYGTYAVMPIPYTMAITWFVGTLIECAVAGLVVGVVVKD